MDVARLGAQLLFQTALEAEVDGFLGGECDARGDRARAESRGGDSEGDRDDHCRAGRSRTGVPQPMAGSGVRLCEGARQRGKGAAQSHSGLGTWVGSSSAQPPATVDRVSRVSAGVGNVGSDQRFAAVGPLRAG